MRRSYNFCKSVYGRSENEYANRLENLTTKQWREFKNCKHQMEMNRPDLTHDEVIFRSLELAELLEP